jgi:quinol monooxygenase YgiN
MPKKAASFTNSTNPTNPADFISTNSGRPHCQTPHFKHLEANIAALIAEPLEINLVQPVA